MPAEEREAFPPEGSHLERYAARFDAVEINTSFHRPHRRATYERWAASVGEEFRFSVKLPKSISHARGGAYHPADIDRFAHEVAGLGAKLGVVLVQLPPSHIFDADMIETLFATLSATLSCPLACEPRHASWFDGAADALLANLRVARVGADPPRAARAELPAGWPNLRYLRLHGSPRIYHSKYGPAAIDRLHALVEAEPGEADIWCVFDNTAMGAATANALELTSRR